MTRRGWSSWSRCRTWGNSWFYSSKAGAYEGVGRVGDRCERHRGGEVVFIRAGGEDDVIRRSGQVDQVQPLGVNHVLGGVFEGPQRLPPLNLVGDIGDDLLLEVPLLDGFVPHRVVPRVNLLVHILSPLGFLCPVLFPLLLLLLSRSFLLFYLEN